GQRVRVAYATANYFRVLGALPTLGRGFLDSEDSGPGQHPVAVVSHDLWQDRLGGDPDIVGRTITLNRAPYTVVGVAPEEFRGARPTLGSTGLWVPLTQHPYLAGERDYLRDRGAFWVQVLGRLRPGATLAEANTAVQTVFGRMAEEFPETNQDRSARAASFGRFPAQNRMWDMLAAGVLAGLLALVLMIICGNLAGMALARSASREQEIAVRMALGSSRTRLVRHLMVEALLLAMAGGGIGTLLAAVGMGAVSPATFGIVAPGVAFELNGAVVAASLALTFAAALAVGLLPAIRFSRPELVSSLKDSAGPGGRRVGRIQRFTASAQTGMALLSLVIGSLFLRSLTIMAEGDLGFEPEGMVVTDFRTGALSSALLDLSEEGYPTLEEGAGALLERLSEAIGALPGVASVAFADGVP
ncbi:MAG: ABC transporter permease, partial [Gemmatimonadetes bacterium]|nr:ABC transporter permease [Gemmatimonadota bacterium]